MNIVNSYHFARLAKVTALAISASLSVAACTVSVDAGAENRFFGISLKTTVGSGKTATEQRSVVAFERIEVRDGIRLNLQKGSEQKVTVSADDNVLPLVDVSVSGANLSLRMKPKTNIRTKNPIVVTVEYVKLDKIVARDGASVDADALSAPTLALQVSDGASLKSAGVSASKLDIAVKDGASARIVSARGSDTQSFSVSDGASLKVDAASGGETKVTVSDGAAVSMQTVDVKTINVSVSDGATANLSGAAAQQVFSVSDGATINARALNGEAARGKVKDGASLRVGTLKTLDVEVDESASVRYAGDPQVTVRSSEKMNVKKY